MLFPKIWSNFSCSITPISICIPVPVFQFKFQSKSTALKRVVIDDLYQQWLKIIRVLLGHDTGALGTRMVTVTVGTNFGKGCYILSLSQNFLNQIVNDWSKINRSIYLNTNSLKVILKDLKFVNPLKLNLKTSVKNIILFCNQNLLNLIKLYPSI